MPNIKDQDVAADISQLAAVSRTPDHLDLIWVGRDGALRHHWWDAVATNGAWNSDHWASPITQPGSARTYSPLSIIARTPTHLQVFYIAPDASVWTHWWAEQIPGFGGGGPVPGGWRVPGPEMIAPPGSARPWAGLTAVATTSRRIDVFWVGPDAAIWSHWWEEGGGNGNWTARPPSRVSPENSVGARSGLACVQRVPGQVDLFWITAPGAVASIYRNDSVPGQGWTGPFDLTPPATAHTHSSVYAVAREPEHLDLTWIGSDGSLRTHWWHQNSEGAWDKHPPGVLTAPGTVQLLA